MAEKILVVEDERNIASFVAMYLKNARYQVDIARDGTEALQKADSTKPDLVVLDGRGLTREQLLARVWGYTLAGDTRTVDVHVRQLRRKLGDDCPVATVWGVGYKVADDAAVT